MSDRASRDRGTKISKKKNKTLCQCWHCVDGKTKKRELERKNKKEIQRTLGYSRIGLGNI